MPCLGGKAKEGQPAVVAGCRGEERTGSLDKKPRFLSLLGCSACSSLPRPSTVSFSPVSSQARSRLRSTGEVTTGHRLNQSEHPPRRSSDPVFPLSSSFPISSHFPTHPARTRTPISAVLRFLSTMLSDLLQRALFPQRIFLEFLCR